MADVRQRIREALKNADHSIIGYLTDDSCDRATIVQIETSRFDAAIEKLAAVGIPFIPQHPLRPDEVKQLEAAVQPLYFSKLDDIDLGTFREQIKYFVPSYWRGLGVALVDLVGFSTRPMATQLRLLKQLEEAIEFADRKSKLLYPDLDLSEIARASTGDGYYLFPFQPDPDSNRRVLALLFLLAAKARQMGLEIKSAFTLDECFVFYRFDGDEVLNQPGVRPSKTSVNLIGAASNKLARMIEKSVSEQILLSNEYFDYLKACHVAREEVGFAPKSLHSRPIGGYGGSSLKSIIYPQLIDILNRINGTKVIQWGHIELFSPSQPILIRDKHGDLHFVWNFRSGVSLGEAAVGIGVVGADVTSIDSMQFWRQR
jgi:hypothetical protein